MLVISVKKSLVFLFLNFFLSAALHAQIKVMTVDSISTYLCKTWVEKARFLGGMQIGSLGAHLTYNFRPDSTFIKSIDETSEQGTWSYDESKKIVSLYINRKVNFYIVHLTNDELLFSSDLEEGPKKGLGILVLFHPMKK